MGYEAPAKAPMRFWDPMSKADFRYGPYLPGRPHRCCMSCDYYEQLEAYLCLGETQQGKHGEFAGWAWSDQASFTRWRFFHGIKCPSCSVWCCQHMVLQGSVTPFSCVVERLPTLQAEPRPWFLVLFLSYIRDWLSVACPLGHSFLVESTGISCVI